MGKLELGSKITRAFGKAGLFLKQHSPEIMIVGGCVGVVASAIMACKATTKLSKITDEMKAAEANVQEMMERATVLPIDYTEKDAKKDLVLIRTKGAMEIAKLYAPAVTIGGLSLACILGSHNILSKRSAALAAAYSTMETGFKDYRKRVVERFGEELDKELRYNIKDVKVEEEVVDENGKKKKVEKTIKVADSNAPSPYSKFYDEYCTGWQKDAEQNLWFLQQQQKFANEKLKAQGYLFLNEVYESLGIQKTQAGQVVGWVYNSEQGDDFVDFGIYNVHRDDNRDFVNGYNPSILLDFNVQGRIDELVF